MNFNKELLEKKIVFLQPNDPFTWASGIKSPIYCDNRLILQYPDLTDFVAKELVSLIKDNFSNEEVIMSTSTAGIPHGTLVANKMWLPCGYVRGSAKAHGRSNQIEGANIVGKKVIVVEDLISTGGSVLEVVKTLRENGADVLGVVGIFSYDMQKAKDLFKKEDISLFTISNINKLLEVASKNGYLNSDEIDLIIKFISSL